MTVNRSLRFGVNYVPSAGWWYSWVDWNQGSIDADLAAVADLGMDHIRVMCLWPLFQPNPTLVSGAMLRNLNRLMSSAERVGLDVVITVFNGWLSGYDFRPSWLAAGSAIFTDPATIRAQLLLLTEIAGQVGSAPNLIGIDLANEPSALASGDASVTPQSEGDAWMTRLLAHCEAVLPGRRHTVGMDHVPWLTERSSFSRARLSSAGDLTSIHAWTFFTGALERYGASGVGTIHLAEFMLELAKAFSVEPDREVWLQEYGLAPEWMSEVDGQDFIRHATLAAARVEGLWGITWWCSHDIDRALEGFAQLEYDLGLLTVRNEVKDSGETLRSVIHELREGGDLDTERPTALVLPDALTPGLEFADRFFALVEQGVRPAVVLEARAQDHAYLSSRGIRTLVPVDTRDIVNDH